jgi:hypothetical protein
MPAADKRGRDHFGLRDGLALPIQALQTGWDLTRQRFKADEQPMSWVLSG